MTFSFAGSSDLARQLTEGAPADVFASADLPNMTKLDDGAPVVFATNRLEIIVAPGNPAVISDVADLANPDLIVVTCAMEVPCGAYAGELFANAGVAVTPKSFEENVKAVANKVVLGEADAGIVYATDVLAAGDGASGVPIPDDINIVAEYPITVTPESSNPGGAQAFVDFVRSDAGQTILTRHGFSSP